jgi:hypothetical protein
LIARQTLAGNEQLFNLPFQRAGLALGANQALFQQLTGAGVPALQSLLNARMAQPSITQGQEGMGIGQMMEIGKNIAAVGAAPFTGGASLAALGMGGFGGGGGGGGIMQNASGLVQIPNQTGGFSTFDPSKFIGPFGGRGMQ